MMRKEQNVSRIVRGRKNDTSSEDRSTERMGVRGHLLAHCIKLDHLHLHAEMVVVANSRYVRDSLHVHCSAH